MSLAKGRHGLDSLRLDNHRGFYRVLQGLLDKYVHC